VNLAEKEAAETVYWLEICMEAGIGANQEAKELLAIFTAAGRTSK